MLDTTQKIIGALTLMSDPEVAKRKYEKFGIKAEGSFGIYQKDINELIKQVPKDSGLAIELFETGIYEARIVCSKIYRPRDLKIPLAKKWVKELSNWEICDSFSMLVFARSPIAIELINTWHNHKPEFERRAAFATMAGFCSADKKAQNSLFQDFYPIIIAASSDDRLYVKKAVNWALRSIGKRNPDLLDEATNVAEEILKLGTKSGNWIAKDALREFSKPNVRISNYPREIYG